MFRFRSNVLDWLIVVGRKKEPVDGLFVSKLCVMWLWPVTETFVTEAQCSSISASLTTLYIFRTHDNVMNEDTCILVQ